MKHYVVTTKKGNQYRVPSRRGAEETFQARGGVSIEETGVTRLRDQGWMFKPLGAEKWQEWPSWDECND